MHRLIIMHQCRSYESCVCSCMSLCASHVSPLRSADFTSNSCAPWRATMSAPSWFGKRPALTSLRASSKGTSSAGKGRWGRPRPELLSRPASLLVTGGTGLRSRASASIVELRNGLGSCWEWGNQEMMCEISPFTVVCRNTMTALLLRCCFFSFDLNRRKRLHRALTNRKTSAYSICNKINIYKVMEH